MNRSFLLKHVKATLVLESPDNDDNIVVGLARGDASVTQIKAALELDPVDSDLEEQAQARTILWETVRVLYVGLTDAQQYIDVSIGGGKGIPFEQNEGWQWFAYNQGANDQVAGAVVVGIGMLAGIWL